MLGQWLCEVPWILRGTEGDCAEVVVHILPPNKRRSACTHLLYTPHTMACLGVGDTGERRMVVREGQSEVGSGLGLSLLHLSQQE